MNLIPIRFKFSVQFILAIFFVTILSGRYKLQSKRIKTSVASNKTTNNF